jgi:hypothetical protein
VGFCDFYITVLFDLVAAERIEVGLDVAVGDGNGGFGEVGFVQLFAQGFEIGDYLWLFPLVILLQGIYTLACLGPPELNPFIKPTGSQNIFAFDPLQTPDHLIMRLDNPLPIHPKIGMLILHLEPIPPDRAGRVIPHLIHQTANLKTLKIVASHEHFVVDHEQFFEFEEGSDDAELLRGTRAFGVHVRQRQQLLEFAASREDCDAAEGARGDYRVEVHPAHRGHLVKAVVVYASDQFPRVCLVETDHPHSRPNNYVFGQWAIRHAGYGGILPNIEAPRQFIAILRLPDDINDIISAHTNKDIELPLPSRQNLGDLASMPGHIPQLGPIGNINQDNIALNIPHGHTLLLLIHTKRRNLRQSHLQKHIFHLPGQRTPHLDLITTGRVEPQGAGQVLAGECWDVVDAHRVVILVVLEYADGAAHEA